ncbi:MAG: family acetyltransferase [Paenibacillaceae bacterium]|nr:family acetyltransferase [Paenibacillaceae bacterium]
MHSHENALKQQRNKIQFNMERKITVPHISVQTVSYNDPHLHQLIRSLDDELLERYPPEEIFTLDFNDPHVQEISFAVAYLGDEPIGCGAIRPLEGEEAELKRFYVEREHRGSGAAALILRHLEENALRDGFRIIKLETGPEQPESLRFYAKNGYFEIPRFGPYVECHSSMCFEKRLQPAEV